MSQIRGIFVHCVRFLFEANFLLVVGSSQSIMHGFVVFHSAICYAAGNSIILLLCSTTSNFHQKINAPLLDHLGTLTYGTYRHYTIIKIDYYIGGRTKKKEIRISLLYPHFQYHAFLVVHTVVKLNFQSEYRILTKKTKK